MTHEILYNNFVVGKKTFLSSVVTKLLIKWVLLQYPNHLYSTVSTNCYCKRLEYKIRQFHFGALKPIWIF